MATFLLISLTLSAPAPELIAACPQLLASQRIEWAIERGLAPYSLDGDAPAARHERGLGPAADERPAAPPIATLDGLEEEAVVAAHHPGERCDRRSCSLVRVMPCGASGALGCAIATCSRAGSAGP